MLSTALLSHGDTKQIMLIPASVEECYTMAMDAFDLAERFQSLVFVMSDLDLGMNTWMSRTFEYPEQPLDRGKVLDADELARIGELGPLQGRGRRRHSVPHDPRHDMPAYFTRGSGHNEKAQYSERPDDYVNNMDRLRRKFETARQHVPKPEVVDDERRRNRHHRLRHQPLGHRGEPRSAASASSASGPATSGCAPIRSRAELDEFIDRYDRVYVVEQNRDAQMLGLMRLD